MKLLFLSVFSILLLAQCQSGNKPTPQIQTFNTGPGALDMSFNVAGYATFAFVSIGIARDQGQGIALQTDGKVVISGFTYDGTRYRYALIRYQNDGRPDTTWGTDGTVATDVGGFNDQGTDIRQQADGKLVQCGYSSNGTKLRVGVVRYLSNGNLDTTFSGTGKSFVSFSTGDDYCLNETIQPDGKIILLGYSRIGSNTHVSMARLLTNGSLDTSFGNSGIVNTSIGVKAQASGVVLLPNGKILLAGYSTTATLFSQTLLRYNTDGTLDTTFNGVGYTVTPMGSEHFYGNDVALQTDGKALVCGYAKFGSGYDITVTRYNTNGTIDTSYANNGTTIFSVGSGDDKSYRCKLQADGKLVVVGNSQVTGQPSEFLLTRFNTNGSVDTDFGIQGASRLSIGDVNDISYRIALTDDKKILVTGYSTIRGPNTRFATARFFQ